MSQNRSSTYYTCNGCDHATFRLSEAIAHMAFFGEHHAWDCNGQAVVIPLEWKPIFDEVRYAELERNYRDIYEDE